MLPQVTARVQYLALELLMVLLASNQRRLMKSAVLSSTRRGYCAGIVLLQHL